MRKPLPTISTSIVCALVASMVTMGVAALCPVRTYALPQPGGDTAPQAPAPRPALVVGIFVEGLDADYINLLRHNMSADGFNRFIRDGLTIENVQFGPGIDATAATAMLVSGSAPGVNGIPSERVWNSSARVDMPVLLPADKAGRYSERDLTPAPLLVSTVSDEVRIADGGIGSVHSLASDPQIAVILAGHAGNSAFWISDIDGKWTGSKAYADTPRPISRRNTGLTMASRLDTMSWTPLLPLTSYPDLPAYKKCYPFRYTFPARLSDRFTRFKASATGNREIAEAAVEYISTLSLGGSGATDMLSLGFDLRPYRWSQDPDCRIENMDAYLRLDRDIASIVNAVSHGPGMERTLLFIAGTPAPAGGKRDDERWGIPSGRFSPRKAMSLLNLYLMALHGNGEWVNGYHNGFFYLNRPLLKERGLVEADVRREAAEFLARMSGVSDVYTIDDILARRAGDQPMELNRNISPVHAGDVMVRVNPGWMITDADDDEPVDPDQQVERWQSTTSPVYILAPSISASEIVTPVDARAIAPTLTRILRIRSPNAAALPGVL